MGHYFDLGEIFAQLNATYFHNSCSAKITWGRAGTVRRRRRSIQLGCYVAALGLIRIHPCLDQAFVPSYFVTWVVYHEMLHEVWGAEGRGSKKAYHPPIFGALEQTYPAYAQCQIWQHANLGRLLRFRPERHGS